MYNFSTKRITDQDILIAKVVKEKNQKKYIYLTKSKVEDEDDYEDNIKEFYDYVNKKYLNIFT